jgi:hypothetical protein
MQANQGVTNILFELYKKYPEFCDREQILCSSLANKAFDRFFGIIPNSRKSQQINTFFRKTLFSKIIRKNIETISKRLLLYGRMNDSIPHLQKAIDLGNLSARADFALLCFNQNFSHNECKKTIKLLKEGVDLGCKNCQGMLGYSYFLMSSFYLAYAHAIESADAGSIFGKFALAKFLHNLSISHHQDEYEETFFIYSDEKFISNFIQRKHTSAASAASAAVNVDEYNSELDDFDSDLDDFYNNSDFLNCLDQRRIAFILFDEIREEYAKNPMCPKVWASLPSI